MRHTIYLSKRNLQTLLSKLERKEAGENTACTIVKFRNSAEEFQQTMDNIDVVAVPDEEYYNALGRAPGGVHPSDQPK